MSNSLPRNSLFSHSHKTCAPLRTHSLVSALFHLFYYWQGSNLGRNAAAIVAVISTVFCIIFVVLAILGQGFLLSAAGAAIMVILVIFYLVGASKLANAVGDRNPTGLRVVTLTRQVAASLVCSILVHIPLISLHDTSTIII